MLDPWVAWSIWLPSCFSLFICTQMWDCLVCQLPPHPVSEQPHCTSWSSSSCPAVSPLHPSCPSLPLLLVWMNVFSLTLWLSDFHTAQLSGSPGCFLFLNLLSFFWLCEEAKYIYLCLHLGWKSNFLVLCFCKRKVNGILQVQKKWGN